MPNPTHIKVIAPEGKLTPIGAADGVEPGGALMCVSGDRIRRVRYSQDIRRSIARGDLIPCDMNGAACTIDLAAQPEDLGSAAIETKKPAQVEKTKGSP